MHVLILSGHLQVMNVPVSLHKLRIKKGHW